MMFKLAKVCLSFSLSILLSRRTIVQFYNKINSFLKKVGQQKTCLSLLIWPGQCMHYVFTFFTYMSIVKQLQWVQDHTKLTHKLIRNQIVSTKRPGNLITFSKIKWGWGGERVESKGRGSHPLPVELVMMYGPPLYTQLVCAILESPS